MNNMLNEQTSELEFLEHLAFSLFQSEQFFDSAICYERIIELDPSHAKAYYNLGVVLHDMGQFDYSLLHYEKAKELGYDCSRVNLNIGMHFLKLRDFKNGFECVDLQSGGAWRLGQNFDVNKDRLSDIELWEGQNPQGKNILVYSEQGFGDNIQFSRYLPELSRLSGDVTFLCYDALAPVIRNSHAFDDIDVLDSINEYVIDLDYRVPLMSVPRLIEATSESDKQGSFRSVVPASSSPTAMTTKYSTPYSIPGTKNTESSRLALRIEAESIVSTGNSDKI